MRSASVSASREERVIFEHRGSDRGCGRGHSASGEGVFRWISARSRARGECRRGSFPPTSATRPPEPRLPSPLRPRRRVWARVQSPGMPPPFTGWLRLSAPSSSRRNTPTPPNARSRTSASDRRRKPPHPLIRVDKTAQAHASPFLTTGFFWRRQIATRAGQPPRLRELRSSSRRVGPPHEVITSGASSVASEHEGPLRIERHADRGSAFRKAKPRDEGAQSPG